MERRRTLPYPKGKWIKGARWSLLKSPDVPQLPLLGEVQQANKPMFRAFLLKEELPLLYQLEDPAPAHLDAWLAWASGFRLQPFVKLARPFGVTAPASSPRSASACPTGRLEGLSSRIRLISHRSVRFPQRRTVHRTRLPVLHRHRRRSPRSPTSPITRPERHIFGVVYVRAFASSTGCSVRRWPGNDRLVTDIDSFVGEVHGYTGSWLPPILATRADTSEVLRVHLQGAANIQRRPAVRRAVGKTQVGADLSDP